MTPSTRPGHTLLQSRSLLAPPKIGINRFVLKMIINEKSWRRHGGLLFAVLGFGAIASAQVGLGLSPMRLEFALTPGTVRSSPLTLSNESSAPIRFRAELLDFYIDDQGTPQFAASYPAEADNSCRSWLSLNPMEGEVAPKSSVVVRYTLRVPGTALAHGFHCAAGFSTLAAASQVAGNGLNTAIRMVAAFYPVVGQPAIQGELTKMIMEYVKGGDGPQWRAVVIIKNEGYKYFRAAGHLTVLDENGKVVEIAAFPSLPILPRREQRFLFPLKKISQSHKYTMRARVDLGAAEIQEAVVSVVPPGPGN